MVLAIIINAPHIVLSLFLILFAEYENYSDINRVWHGAGGFFTFSSLLLSPLLPFLGTDNRKKSRVRLFVVLDSCMCASDTKQHTPFSSSQYSVSIKFDVSLDFLAFVGTLWRERTMKCSGQILFRGIWMFFLTDTLLTAHTDSHPRSSTMICLPSRLPLVIFIGRCYKAGYVMLCRITGYIQFLRV